MKFGSVCSGIDAASVAWNPLGWEAAFFAEIEKFPSAVLAHHYPEVPNLGDMTKFKEWPDYELDVLVGGTPCQSFSIAGLRKGLDDPRGNLMLTYLAIAARYRPTWLVWENVPGVLSSNGGKDFGTFLGGLGELGYGFAYRVLDAQYAGVPQRRRRVFVVGCLGSWQRAAAVLFERHSLSGDTPPRREKGEEITGTIGARTTAGGGFGGDFETAGGLQAVSNPGWPAEVACTLDTTMQKYMGLDNQHVNAGCPLFVPDVIHSLRAEGFDPSEDGTGRGTPLIPIQNATRGKDQNGLGIGGDVMFTLDQGSQHAVAFAQNQRDEVRTMNVAGALAAEPGMKQQTYVATPINTQMATRGPETSNSNREGVGVGEPGDPAFTLQSAHSHAVQNGMQVRRLTPRECERLQGFPDDYTLIPGKAADGPRYKSLGNSMAVPCMAWLGSRIDAVSKITSIQKKEVA